MEENILRSNSICYALHPAYGVRLLNRFPETEISLCGHLFALMESASDFTNLANYLTSDATNHRCGKFWPVFVYVEIFVSKWVDRFTAIGN